MRTHRGRGEDNSPGVDGFGRGKRKMKIAILCTERAHEENLVRTCAIVWRTLIGGCRGLRWRASWQVGYV